MMRFGSDPEFFVVKKSAGPYAHSIHLLKNFEPFGATARASYGTCEVVTDGFAVELHPQASTCRDYAVPNIGRAIATFSQRYSGYALNAIPKRKLTKESLRGTLPEGVQKYGCVPDRDAYRQTDKAPPGAEYRNRYRYTGGHLHFSSYTWSTMETGPRTTALPVKDPDEKDVINAALTLMLDCYLGLPLVSVIGRSNDWGEADRRTLYGQAGSYRNKPYGLEYRVPSSVIFNSPILLTWAIGQARKVLGFYSAALQGERRNDASPASAAEKIVDSLHGRFDLPTVREIINTHNVDAARETLVADRAQTKAAEQYTIRTLDDVSTMHAVQYQPKFYDLMVAADREGVGFSHDTYANWGLPWFGGDPVSHDYLGVETSMKGNWHKVDAKWHRLPRPWPQAFKDATFPQYSLIGKVHSKPKASWAF